MKRNSFLLAVDYCILEFHLICPSKHLPSMHFDIQAQEKGLDLKDCKFSLETHSGLESEVMGLREACRMD
jgi:hypothetical protein